jgi:LysM repeat protein
MAIVCTCSNGCSAEGLAHPPKLLKVRPILAAPSMRNRLFSLLLLVSAALPLQAAEPVHVVQQKETLTAIAKLYGIPVATLISLNGIEDANKLKWGTSLKLPAGTRPVASAPEVAAPVAKAPGTQAPAVKAPAAQAPKAQAAAAAPQLMAKKSATPDWRLYGPLQVDWSNWRSMAGSLVAPSINKDGQPLYVAVNCGARKLNVTGPAGAWKTWELPAQEFEKELVGAVCKDASLQKG